MKARLLAKADLITICCGTGILVGMLLGLIPLMVIVGLLHLVHWNHLIIWQSILLPLAWFIVVWRLAKWWVDHWMRKDAEEGNPPRGTERLELACFTAGLAVAFLMTWSTLNDNMFGVTVSALLLAVVVAAMAVFHSHLWKDASSQRE